MHATPIQTYYDNPAAQTDYIMTLNKEETALYMKGYIQACLQFSESLTETKQRFLVKCLDFKHEAEEHKRLMSHVILLDMLDEAVHNRVTMLSNAHLD